MLIFQHYTPLTRTPPLILSKFFLIYRVLTRSYQDFKGILIDFLENGRP